MDSPRIKTITIHDFKGFHLNDVQSIDLKGKNLLLYGENGSGKTTIFTALKELLSRVPTREFDNDFSKASCLKNRLSPVKSEEGKVRLEFEAANGKPINNPMEWRINTTRPISHSYFLPMSLCSGFLDYRAILLTHFLDYENDQINLFKLVVETLLRDVQMELGNMASFGTEWKGIQDQQHKVAVILNTDYAKIDPAFPGYHRLVSELGFDAQDYAAEDEEEEINIQNAFSRFCNSKHEELSERIEDFAEHLRRHLGEVQILANRYLQSFDPLLEIMFDLDTMTIPTEKSALASAEWKNMVRLPLRANFRGNRIEHPGTVFNEARLTALALTIYLAALKVQAEVQKQTSTSQKAPRLLVLDDVLIGLDMVHRLPILQTLETEFIADDWQVILLTFDRTWYDVAKQRVTGKWEKYELFAIQNGDYEKPVLLPDADHLKRAQQFLKEGQVKAAAVHIRTKFELVVRNACTRLHVPVPYSDSRPPEMRILWNALIKHSKECRNKNPNNEIVSVDVEARNEYARQWILNPLSHSRDTNSYRLEIDKAICAVKDLETSINAALKRRGLKTADEGDE
jgi:energy-coupling factor transporter ATP-binding protein EcfA2